MDWSKCGEKTISFLQWCNGINSWRWTCPHCQASLAISVRVLIATVIFAIGAFGIAGYGIYMRPPAGGRPARARTS